ncbi:helix-turn-helix domain-containing protein [Streptomyces sp. NPDC001292]|uniref:helix-turn-helix domain-containing protein n=1 Tax=Streptomyces sp. NPDC001292 TaxID=3364558 RepID=UPI0036C1521C
MARFESGEKIREIAAALRVGEQSVERWRKVWREQGEAELLSNTRRADHAGRDADRPAGAGVGARAARARRLPRPRRPGPST